MSRSIALALSISLAAFAQNYPQPASVAEEPVLCSGCPGGNSSGQPNDGLPLAPYDVPLVAHAGRYVDSSSTIDVHSGLRTLRAGRVRVNAGHNRVYLQLGGAIGAYGLDTFFTGRLAEPMLPVGGIDTGTPLTGRNPLEKAARVDAFVDAGAALEDFDVDDRGYVYYRSSTAWGIHQDDGRTDGTRLPFASQAPAATSSGATLLTVRLFDSYYVYTSDAQGARIYNVDDPANPVLTVERPGVERWAKAWAKSEVTSRIAMIGGDGHLRIYTRGAVAIGGHPLAELLPDAGRQFVDVSYDEEGNLWVALTGTVESSAWTSIIWRLQGDTSKSHFTAGGTGFVIRRIHAAGGYVAAVGTDAFGSKRVHDLQLVGLSSQTVDTQHWFRRYYHQADFGFAQPAGFTQDARPFLFAQGGRTYLFYSAHGLGDVYELGEELRPPAVRITTASPLIGPPSGGTTVTIDGRNFGQDAVASFGGTPAQMTFVSATRLIAIAPPHAAGTVTLTVASNGQTATGPRFTYAEGEPSRLTATAAGTQSVSLSWNAWVSAARYEVFRNGTFVGTTTDLTYSDGGVLPDTAYVYYVRAVDASGSPVATSVRDVAVTAQVSDADITPGKVVKAAHLAEVRRLVNMLRAAAGRAPGAWTESAQIRAVQLTELRTALNEARTLLGVPALSFTDGVLAGVKVKAVHMQELMGGVR
jgi:hypothetical protein